MFLSMKRHDENSKQKMNSRRVNMTNFDNKLNINNNLHTTYTPSAKKEETKPQPRVEETAPEVINDGTQAAESYGRILVRKGNFDNAQMVQSIKDSIDFFVENPDRVAASVRAGDDAYELLEAAGAKDAYEKSCCGSCDAAYFK